MTPGFEPNSLDVALAAVDYVLSGTDTVRVGVVSRYDAQTRRADVVPSVGAFKQDPHTLEVEWTPAAVVHDVPVALPGTDRNPIHLHLKSGDLVLLVTAWHSIEEILGGQKLGVTPRELHRGDIQDSFALPFTLSHATTSEREANVAITGTDIRIGDASAAGPLATPGSVDTLASGIEAALAAGVVAAGGIGTPAGAALEAVRVAVSALPPAGGTTHLKGS